MTNIYFDQLAEVIDDFVEGTLHMTKEQKEKAYY